MNFLTGLGRLERAAFVFFSLFVLLQCLSIAAANIALGFSVFFLVLQLIRTKGSISNQSLTTIYKENNWLIWLFGFFWLTIFCSALASGAPIKGLKIFLGQFVYRTSPLFIILFFFGKKRYASFFLALSILSCVLDVIGGMIIHGDGPRLRGLYGHPMTLAGFLLTSLPILFCFLLDWKQDRKTLFVTIMFFLIGFTGLLLNGTRGAWLALAVSLPLVAVLYDHSIKKILFLVIFAVGTSLVFFNSPQLQNRAESITSTTMQSNTEMFIVSALGACDKQTVYHAFQSIPQEGWKRQDTLLFNVAVPDSQTYYKLIVEIRNRSTYPYQNINLSVCYDSPELKKLQTDTLTAVLADKEGIWKGDGWGGLYQSAFPAGNTSSSWKSSG